MNGKASIAVTGGVSVTVAFLLKPVAWALIGFPKPVPDEVVYLVAAAIPPLVHIVISFANSILKKDNLPTIPDPTNGDTK